MARRTRDESTTSTSTEEVATEAAPVTEEAPVTAVTEESTTDTAAEAPAEGTEAPATEAAKPAETPIDLTAFIAKVNEAVASRDEASGDLTEEAITSAQTEYRALDGLKAKNAAKKHVEEAMREAMNRRDISTARAFMQVSDNLTAGASKGADKPPADPKEAFVQRYTALALALELVSAEAPEGVEVTALAVTDEQRAQAQALLAYERNEAEDKGDAPESSPVVKAAVKLSTGKAAKVGGTRTGGTFTGERRDIGKHIAEAFAGVEDGTFLTVAQIRSHKSEEYGDNPPSAGAISARLFPTSGKCTVEGVEPGQNDKGNKGAKKVAA